MLANILIAGLKGGVLDYLENNNILTMLTPKSATNSRYKQL